MNPIILIRETINFVKHIFQNKYLLFELSRRDFKQKYVTNIMGITWAIIDPLIMMLIFWLIFGLGFRGGQHTTVPYITYLIPALIAYLFFQNTLSQATNSIKAYSFLLKKVNVRISILPIVKILSELTLHIIVIILAIIIIMLNGIYPSLYWLQIFYYILASCILLLGLSWFTSSVNLFFPDISNIISIILRFFFYLTPIFWNPSMLPEKYVFILKLNPLYYIVNGYRDSLLFKRPFWAEWQLMIYFWALTFIIIIVGIIVFSRLRPHFADVV